MPVGSVNDVISWTQYLCIRQITACQAIMCCSSLRCCHISPDSANGRRTDRKNAKNVYPVEKVVLVAMEVVAEGVRSA